MALASLSPAARTQVVVPGIITVLVAILIFGFASLIVGWIPFTFGDVAWRFGVAGQLLGASQQIAFILMILIFVALYGGQYRTMRWASLLAILIGVIVLATVPAFALDFLTERHLQPQNVIDAYTRKMIGLGFFAFILGLAMIWGGRLGFLASATEGKDAPRVSGQGLIVGQDDS
jgi:hypothetical protein